MKKNRFTQRTLPIALASGLVVVFAGCQTAPVITQPGAESHVNRGATGQSGQATNGGYNNGTTSANGANNTTSGTSLANSPGNDPTIVRSPIHVTDEVRNAYPQGPDGTISGHLIDQFGSPAQGVSVHTSRGTATTDKDGFYTIAAASGPVVWIRYGEINDSKFVYFDDHLPVLPTEEVVHDSSILQMDDTVTHVESGHAAIAKSSPLDKVLADSSMHRREARLDFGLLAASDNQTIVDDLDHRGLSAVQITIPQGALIGTADVRLTWLNPLPMPGKPNGDLYGPLTTTTDWDGTQGVPGSTVVPLAPVNFADINLGPNCHIAPGAELTVKWVVGPDTLTAFPLSINGNDDLLLPCYTYDPAAQQWAIPVVARVFKEHGYTWAEYHMHGDTPPCVDASATSTASATCAAAASGASN